MNVPRDTLRTTGDLLQFADQLFVGECDFRNLDRLVARQPRLYELQPGLAYLVGRTTSAAFSTSEGLLLFDSGGLTLRDLDDQASTPLLFDQLRNWSDTPIHTVIISQMGDDKSRGLPLINEEATANGWPRPRIIAHEALVDNAEVRRLMAGYYSGVKERQFQVSAQDTVENLPTPTETYHDTHVIKLGEERFELIHGKGETNDQTWLWAPDRKVVCCGDFFYWSAPNAGNPQRGVRYPRLWAAACREMAAREPEMLLPGHWLPVVGADRVQQVLRDTAEYLERIHDATVELMNDGADLGRIIDELSGERFVSDKPYLRPAYDEPEFVARNIWRLYGGWYDLDPANLKPAPTQSVGTVLAELAGGTECLVDKARSLAASDGDVDLRLAAHLIDLAAAASPDNPDVHTARVEIYTRRAKAERTGVARGIFAAAANESRERLGNSPVVIEHVESWAGFSPTVHAH